MEKAGVRKEQAATSSIARAMWDPFWLMREMFGWGRSVGAPTFDVKETDDGYVCKVNVRLALPPQADAAHVKAELEDGELTLLVPKSAPLLAEPEPVPVQEAGPVAPSPPTRTRRTRKNGRHGSAEGAPRRGTRTRARRR